MTRSIAGRLVLPMLVVGAAACPDSKPEILKFAVKDVSVSCTPVPGAAKATCTVSADAVTAARRPFMAVLAVMDGDRLVQRAVVEISSGRGTYRVNGLEVGTNAPRISVTGVGFIAEPVQTKASVSEVTSTCAEPVAGTDSVACTTHGRVQYSDQGNYLAVVEVRPKGVAPIHAFARLQSGSGSFSVDWNGTKAREGTPPVVEAAALGIVANQPER